MKKLLEKNELLFALAWIGFYCAVESLAYPLSSAMGVENAAAAIINVALTAVIYLWLRKQGLLSYYGLCASKVPLRRMLWYLPLIVVSTSNLWHGVAVNMQLAACLCYMVSMLCVGFLEEILFRGFLFNAIRRDSEWQAVVITSLTFGLGHILNLVNGSGAATFETICQIFFAVGMGLLFAAVISRGGSLWPCICAHSAIDVLSTFANEAGLTPQWRLILGTVEMAIALPYAIYLLRRLPAQILPQ